MNIPALAGAIALGYLVGAIPTGLLVGKSMGVDLREVGSKNFGFTNAWRVLGAKPGLLVIVVDVGKAFAAPWFLPKLIVGPDPTWAPLVVGLAVMLGNLFNIFLKGNGGKGIASGLGVFLAVATKAMAVGFVLTVFFLAVTRYMSLASLIGATTLAIGSWVWYPGPVAYVTTAVVSAVWWKHRENIKRLLNGTERKFGKAGTEAPQEPTPAPVE